VAVHVRPDDVHLVGEPGADLRDVDFVHRTRDDRPGVDRANAFVGLRHRIAVHAGTGAIADNSGAALTAVRAAPAAATPGAGRAASTAGRLRGRSHDRGRHAGAAFARRHGRVVGDARGVRVAVALELRLDPVHGVAIALGALTPIAELRQAFDRRFVFLEIEPSDHRLDGILGRGCRGGRLGLRAALRDDRRGKASGESERRGRDDSRTHVHPPGESVTQHGMLS
jgi:hypothetical protein